MVYREVSERINGQNWASFRVLMQELGGVEVNGLFNDIHNHLCGRMSAERNTHDFC